MTATKLGRDLKVGDTILFLASLEYTITHFEAHPGLDGYAARVACNADNDWAMTVFDDDYVAVVVPDNQGSKLLKRQFVEFLNDLLGR